MEKNYCGHNKNTKKSNYNNNFLIILNKK